jgi:hypothetical protein
LVQRDVNRRTRNTTSAPRITIIAAIKVPRCPEDPVSGNVGVPFEDGVVVEGPTVVVVGSAGPDS